MSPPQRSVSPAPTARVPAPNPPSRDLERSGSLPLSALSHPTRAATDDSSSSLKGGDSLPRIPLRRSITEDYLIEDVPPTQDNAEDDEQPRKNEQQPSKPDEAKKAACEKNRKSPTSVRSIEESRLDKKPAAEKSPPSSSDECTADTKLTEKDSKDSSLCSLDESSLLEKKVLTEKNSSTELTAVSNTEVEVEAVEADEQVDDEKREKKQGRLKKMMSNSFKSIGKGSSFRHSFKALGKTMRRKDEVITGTKYP
jgi:hypothetical protein